MVSSKAGALISSALKEGRTSLLEFEADQVAREYGIKVAEAGLAKNRETALSIARRIGFPLVMKIVSPDIIHKSDVGGVIVGVDSNGGVSEAFLNIMRNAKRARPKAKIEGVLVQKMAPKSFEFVVGGVRDPQFGPTVMFGLGGIYIELFKDVAFRLAPLSKREAISMMEETKSSALLSGFRGSKPLDIDSGAEMIIAVGKLISENPQVQSVDINPLFIYDWGSLAVDVRIIVG